MNEPSFFSLLVARLLHRGLHSANRFCSALQYFSKTFQVKYNKLREVMEGHACESIQLKWEGQGSGHDAGERCAMFGTVKQQTYCKKGQYLKRWSNSLLPEMKSSK